METIITGFTSSTSWICPSGVSSVTVECWGGGGSGAGATTSIYTGGGGGGAYSKGDVNVSLGNSYTVTVGALADGTLDAGTPGNPSWFSGVTTVFAAGGGAGQQTSAGSGGQASAGYPTTGGVRYSGGTGAYASNAVRGGGGGAGSTGDGGSSTGTGGGTGTSELGGDGGPGVSNPADATSAAGLIYGGGGGGIRRTNGDRYGGNGAQGYVRLTYTIVPKVSRAFAYNTGTTISNTEQVGDLCVATDTTNIIGTSSQVKWFMGPSELLGYVVTYPVPQRNHPTPVDNVGEVGFKRSKLLTDESLLILINQLRTRENLSQLSLLSEGLSWLDSINYWYSYGKW